MTVILIELLVLVVDCVGLAARLLLRLVVLLVHHEARAVSGGREGGRRLLHHLLGLLGSWRVGDYGVKGGDLHLFYARGCI